MATSPLTRAERERAASTGAATRERADAHPGSGVEIRRSAVPGLGVTAHRADPGRYAVRRSIDVGAADDPLEAEADRVATDVVAAPRRRAVGPAGVTEAAHVSGAGLGPPSGAGSTPGGELQVSHQGGVKSEFGPDPIDPTTNRIELHIEAGANEGGTLMQDFLLALYEARDTLRTGQSQTPPVAGYVFMRPGGSKVLKMTMEMLGEAIGTPENKALARKAKAARPKALPAHLKPDQADDVLHQSFVEEHLAYRDALVGVPGVSMAPIGGGTSGGMYDMLDASPGNEEAEDERALYTKAVATMSPFLSIAVSIRLAQVEAIITMMEKTAGFWKTKALQLKYLTS